MRVHEIMTLRVQSSTGTYPREHIKAGRLVCLLGVLSRIYGVYMFMDFHKSIFF